jgi:hypothetical protein
VPICTQRQEAYITEIKEKGVITEAINDWAALAKLVIKQVSGSETTILVLCRLSGLKFCNPYTCSPHDGSKGKLNENKYCTLAYMEDVYYHIPITNQGKHKTGIITPGGSCR